MIPSMIPCIKLGRRVNGIGSFHLWFDQRLAMHPPQNESVMISEGSTRMQSNFTFCLRHMTLLYIGDVTDPVL